MPTDQILAGAGMPERAQGAREAEAALPQRLMPALADMLLAEGGTFW